MLSQPGPSSVKLLRESSGADSRSTFTLGAEAPTTAQVTSSAAPRVSVTAHPSGVAARIGKEFHRDMWFQSRTDGMSFPRCSEAFDR